MSLLDGRRLCWNGFRCVGSLVTLSGGASSAEGLGGATSLEVVVQCIAQGQGFTRLSSGALSWIRGS